MKENLRKKDLKKINGGDASSRVERIYEQMYKELDKAIDENALAERKDIIIFKTKLEFMLTGTTMIDDTVIIRHANEHIKKRMEERRT